MITLECEKNYFQVFFKISTAFFSLSLLFIIVSNKKQHFLILFHSCQLFSQITQIVIKENLFLILYSIQLIKLFTINMQEKIDDFIDCPNCNSKLFKEVWGIHKIMCHKSKSILKKQKETSSSFLNYFSSSKETEEKNEENLIPCSECGESVPFELYALHESECIGQQLVQCRNCSIKFPVFLIEQHNGVCEGKGNNIEYMQENEWYNEQQGQQEEQANEQLLALIQNLALEVESIKQQGLNQKQLKSLKSQFITKQQQCSICCTRMRKIHRNVKLNCNHLFHRNCIEPWLSKNPKCPMCRRHALKK